MGQILYSGKEFEDNKATFVCPLLAALTMVFIADKLRIPNQLVAMLYGTLIGFTYAFVPFLSVHQYSFWSPDNILVLCHPIMILEISYNIDIYVFVKSVWQIIILATLGTGFFILAFGFLVITVTERKINLVNIVTAGTTLAAIDVPDVLQELNRIKNLEVIMAGESVFGAALCIMTFTVCLGYYNGIITQWYHVFFFFLRYIVGGIFIGFVIGKICARIYRYFNNDALNAVMAVLTSCYATYFACEHYVYCSSTIATFLIGYAVAKERSRLTPNVDEKVRLFLDNTYDVVEIINCIVLSAYVTCRMVGLYKNFDFAVAVGIYIMGNVLRILIFMLLSPILSRLGCGFNFTTLFTISWAAKRGSLQLLQVIYITHHSLTDKLGTELLCFTLVYLSLSFLINMISLQYILKYFGLIEFTMARKYNITECINMLLLKRNRVMFMHKTNRFFSDLDYDLINKATMLQNPYASVDASLKEIQNEFETSCPICHKSIPYVNSLKELQELLKQVKRKVLQCQRISLMRQCEMGLLARSELKTILQYIESALSSPDLKLKLSYFIDLFHVNDSTERLKSTLERHKLPVITYEIRTNIFTRQYCNVIFTIWYIYYKILLLTTITCLIFTWMWGAYHKQEWTMTVLWVGYGFSTLYVFDIVFKCCTFKVNSVILMYTKQNWRVLELGFLIIDITVFCFSMGGIHVLRIASLVRNIYLIKLLLSFIPSIIKALDAKIDKNFYFAYNYGQAFVNSFEHVQANLHSICKHDQVREVIAAQVQDDKLLITEELAAVQRDRPWVCVTLLTYQIQMAILKAINASALEVLGRGLVEEYEYRELRKIIGSTIKLTNPSIMITPCSGRTMLREIPWLAKDDELFNFIFDNIMMHIWEAGDLICEEGGDIDGIYFITQGLIKVTYKPSDAVLTDLDAYGMLPVKELLANTHFNEPEEAYIMAGSTIGELAYLTGRKYACRIEVKRSACGLIISRNVLEKAADFNTDPVHGFICRMWKFVTAQMLSRMLLDRAHYQNAPIYSLHSVMNSVFVPATQHYKIFQVTNHIEDIFLLDGVLIDDNTKEMYTAPCYIPRSVHQLRFPMFGLTPDEHVQPKIAVIPRSSIDPYQVMEATEDLSELVELPVNMWALIRNSHMRKLKRDMAVQMYIGDLIAKTNKRSQERQSSDIMKAAPGSLYLPDKMRQRLSTQSALSYQVEHQQKYSL